MKTRNILSVAAVSVLALSLAGLATAKGGGKLEKLDTNNDGMISQSEIASHHQNVFQKLDADGSGSITQAEMKAAHEAKRSERDPGKRWLKMLERLDTNKDGTISRAEASKWSDERFSKVDQNGNGQITEAEASAAAKARAENGGKKGRRGGKSKAGDHQQSRCEGRFTKLDANQDGVVSAEEFGAAPTKLMRLDTNQDGSIDAAELKAAQNGKRKGKRGKNRPAE